MSCVKLDLRFPFFERTNSDGFSRVSFNDKYELFESKSNNSYFLLERSQDLSGLDTTLRGIVEGNYYLSSIAFEQKRCFSIGINIDRIKSQTEYLSDLESVIDKILTSLHNKCSLFTSRHEAFHRKYRRAVHQKLLVKSYFLQLFYYLTEDIQNEIVKRNEVDFKGIDLKKIKHVEEKITYDFKSAIPSINEMAEMSVSKFKNLFVWDHSASLHSG